MWGEVRWDDVGCGGAGQCEVVQGKVQTIILIILGVATHAVRTEHLVQFLKTTVANVIFLPYSKL